MIKHCIIGAGPVGLTLAHFFKKFKIPFTVFERQNQISNHPSAHYVNLRTREVFNEIPNLNQLIDSQIDPLENFQNYTYLRRIGEKPFVQTNQFQPNITTRFNQLSKISYSTPVHIPQNELVKILYDEINKEQVKFGHKLQTINQEGNQYVLDFLDEKGNNKKYEVQYIYGCDGFNGFTRNHIKARFMGQQNIQSFLNIHFESQQLMEQVLKYRSMLTFVYNSDVIGVLIAHRIQNGTFAFQIPLDTLMPQYSREKIEQYNQDKVKELINNACSQKVSDINIKSIGLWRMGAVVSNQYFKDNILLVGDAAHAVPPAGGFGMNTGIQDAHNLAHKIQLLQNNDYNPQLQQKLFQCYQDERKQVAYENMNVALNYYQKSLDISKAIGFDIKNLRAFKTVFKGISSFLDDGHTGDFYKKGIRLGSLLIENDYLFQRARSALQELDRKDGLIPLVFEKEEVGFRYKSDFLLDNDCNQRLVGKLIPNISIQQDRNGLRHQVHKMNNSSKWTLLYFNDVNKNRLEATMADLQNKFSYLKNAEFLSLGITLQENGDLQDIQHKQIIVVRPDLHIFGVY